MRIWTMRSDGAFVSNVSVLNQYSGQIAVTPDTGRVDIGFDAVSQPLQIKVRDGKGYESEFTPVMCTHRWPDWGHYSYEMLFVLKSDENGPGLFDTSLYGTVNQLDETASDAPCTKSLSYYGGDPYDRNRDSFTTTSWADTHGQSFVADGDRVRAVLLHGVIGDVNWLTFTVDIMEGGPGGRIIATKTSASHSSIDPWMVGFGENECPVVPGQVYYARISRPGGLSCYIHPQSNYSRGSYYAQGSPVLSQDMKGLVCCSNATQATTGTISGTVRDENGQPLQGTRVTVDSTFRYATTSANGSFSIAGLMPGGYKIKAFRQGYTVQTVGSIDVAAGDVDTADFRLFPLAPVTVQNPGFELGDMTGWTKTMMYGGTYLSPTCGANAHTGSYFSGKAVENKTGFGGAYQTIDVVPGVEYVVSCFLLTDSYNFLRVSEFPTNCTGRFGVDPAGGTDASAPTYVWTPMTSSQNAWVPLDKTVRATGPRMTIYLDLWMTMPENTNIVAFDDINVGAINPSGKVDSILEMPDGTHVGVYGQVVTASTSEMGGCFYIEETDRSQGIRVNTTESIAQGQKVSVSGSIQTVNGERTIVADSVMAIGNDTTPTPLGIRPGMIGEKFAKNTGLLVRTWGKVAAKGTGYIVVSDGNDSVKAYTTANPAVDAYVSVTGTVGAEKSGLQVVPVVRCRTATDVAVKS